MERRETDGCAHLFCFVFFFSLIKMVCKLHSHGGSWENITLLVLGESFLGESVTFKHTKMGRGGWSKLGRT